MNEYARFMDSVESCGIIADEQDCLDHWWELREQLFAEYLMEAGMLPEYFTFDYEGIPHVDDWEYRTRVVGYCNPKRPFANIWVWWQSKPLYWKENKQEGKHGD